MMNILGRTNAPCDTAAAHSRVPGHLRFMAPILLVVIVVATACGKDSSANTGEVTGHVTSVPATGTLESTSTPSPTATTEPTAAATATATATSAPTATPTVSSTIEPELSGAQIVALVGPATPMIIAEGLDWYAIGAGFIYDERGLLVTNAHVVEGAISVSVTFSGNTQTYPARILGRSTCDDLAVLKINATGIDPVVLGDSDDLDLGEPVWALGYPLANDPGEQLSLTQGTITRLHVDANIWDDAIQIDAAINPGNSGGPLVNTYGEVVGINSAGYNGAVAQGMNYAISINHARSVVEVLEEGSNLDWLGMELVPNSPALAAEFGLPSDRGMVVAWVTPGSPADARGLVPGDVILAMQDLPISSMDQVCDIVRTHSFGRTELTLAEDGQDEDTSSESTGHGDDNEDTGQQDDGATQQPDGSGAPVLVSDFEDGNTNPWLAEFDPDGTAEVVDGWYSMHAETDAIGFMVPYGIDPPTSGSIEVEFTLEGQGLFGLIGRWSAGDVDYGFYWCAISDDGSAACGTIVGEESRELLYARPGTVQFNAVNTMSLEIVGNTLSFEVNGQTIGTVSDDALSAGSWGMLILGGDDGMTVKVDRVAITEMTVN